ncbi:MAG: universal stress protein [Nitrososphaeraceae archaeon]|jgi:nucleotide-binding universal stress UspA family protein
MFTKILVPVDGSDNSYKALEAALVLSEKLGSNISVVNVMEQVPITHIESEKLLSELLEAYKKENQEILSKCSDIARQKGTTIKTVLLQGNPAPVILDYSKKENFDLVIMGSRGMGKFKELILGSVSSKIVHHSPCAIMIIK